MSQPIFTGTQHLVNPEIMAFLDTFENFDLRDESLPAIRAKQLEELAALPAPSDAYPDVVRRELLVPGFEGAPDVRVLVYRPRTDAVGLPGLVWIHGGGYVLGSAETDDARSFFLAQALQAVVVNVDYRLAPEANGTSAAEDCYAALTWLHDNAAELNVDIARLAIGGMSAGGGIAAGTTLLARDLGRIPLCQQVLIYPMLDDRTVTRAEPNPLTGEFLWTAENNRYAWGAALGHELGTADVSHYVVPARAADLSGLPPTFISVGSLDLFLEEDLEYAQRLLHAGIPTELHVYPGGYHAFDATPEARISVQMVDDYVRALATAFTQVRD